MLRSRRFLGAWGWSLVVSWWSLGFKKYAGSSKNHGWSRWARGASRRGSTSLVTHRACTLDPVGTMAGLVGTGWTWGWSSRRGSGHCGRSRDHERREVGIAQELGGGSRVDYGDMLGRTVRSNQLAAQSHASCQHGLAQKRKTTKHRFSQQTASKGSQGTEHNNMSCVSDLSTIPDRYHQTTLHMGPAQNNQYTALYLPAGIDNPSRKHKPSLKQVGFSEMALHHNPVLCLTSWCMQLFTPSKQISLPPISHPGQIIRTVQIYFPNELRPDRTLSDLTSTGTHESYRFSLKPRTDGLHSTTRFRPFKAGFSQNDVAPLPTQNIQL
ncbi:hypothetical protein F511_29231 [Dorcoceras hygrometricum]|uniref:Uncharacterized protein n=1 Tax=Dorcoceras hygrometricum TaxID=472368 RepID=A0A2Z7DCT4_9LAMI|nr:hypothetical protein F511_29231 [Dorcoceras hygrometricum]